MTRRSYQRRHLRAPFKDVMIYADGDYALKASTLNISEGGLLVDELPSFPEKNEVPIMLSLPQMPSLKNFTLLKMQTYSKELFHRQVIRVRATLVRREELSQDLDNIFRSRFGLQFVKILPNDQRAIEEYVTTFSSNIIYLQTLIDSFNTDEETRLRTRMLATIMGYQNVEKISHLRAQVGHDYTSLQWL